MQASAVSLAEKRVLKNAQNQPVCSLKKKVCWQNWLSCTICCLLMSCASRSSCNVHAWQSQKCVLQYLRLLSSRCHVYACIKFSCITRPIGSAGLEVLDQETFEQHLYSTFAMLYFTKSFQHVSCVAACVYMCTYTHSVHASQMIVAQSCNTFCFSTMTALHVCQCDQRQHCDKLRLLLLLLSCIVAQS